MKVSTIFITSFNPFVSRNILQTDTLARLKADPSIKIILLCPRYKEDFFKCNFGSGNTIVEGVEINKSNQQDTVFNYLGSSLINTSTLAIHKKEILKRNGRRLFFIAAKLLSIIGRASVVKKVIRWLDEITISKNRFSFYFEKYKPVLIFCTDVFNIEDVHFLAEAKRRQVFTVGMVRSWDNITNKGLFRIKPMRLVVNNEVIKKEVIVYNDVSESNIFVTGMPQYDIFLTTKRVSRRTFFNKVKLNPEKKTILFAPAGNRFYDSDWEILEILKKAIHNKKLRNIQVLLRFPPNDNVDMGSFVPDENFAVDIPGRQFVDGVFRDKEMDRADTLHLADTLHYSDMILSYSSTICIDAAVFDKPIITIAFDSGAKKDYLESSSRFLDFEHVRKFIKTGCVRIALNENELIDHINFYINNPQADGLNRRHLLKEQVGGLDGKAGDRLAVFLQTYL